MFFDFIRKNKVLVLILLSVSAVLLSVLCFACGVKDTAFCDKVGEYSLLAETDAQRCEFFVPFGYKAQSIRNYEAVVPCYGDTFEEYNGIQKSQGLDLVPYGGKKAQVYVFSLEGGQSDSLYGFIIVYHSRVIGGHISDCKYPARVWGFEGGEG